MQPYLSRPKRVAFTSQGVWRGPYSAPTQTATTTLVPVPAVAVSDYTPYPRRSGRTDADESTLIGIVTRDGRASRSSNKGVVALARPVGVIQVFRRSLITLVRPFLELRIGCSRDAIVAREHERCSQAQGGWD